jgi:hypothetical protein
MKKFSLLPFNSLNGQQVISVDYIPDPGATSARLGDLMIPKTWTSSWLSITSPNRIASTIREANIQQYNQALHTLARPYPSVAPMEAKITEEYFISSYKVASESTSLSFSGRHIGHYTAALKDRDLVTMHYTMMSIPFQAGFAPDHLKQVTGIMLKKTPGDSSCH